MKFRMNLPLRTRPKGALVLLAGMVILLAVSSCRFMPQDSGLPAEDLTPSIPTDTPLPEVTLPAERPQYTPGELVQYQAQSGDTVPALAKHFNTSVEEIMAANPIIPADVTTLPEGLPMEIPIYYRPLWGSSLRILPDYAFVYSAYASDFDVVRFVAESDGWLRDEEDFTEGTQLKGGEIIRHVALSYSIHPQLLLAVLEYQTGALTSPVRPDFSSGDILGFNAPTRTRLVLQLNLLANTLNNGYYGWRSGNLEGFTHAADGRWEYPDPWQNAASVGLQYTFAQMMDYRHYRVAISEEGIQKVFINLFGDPYSVQIELIPGSLQVPEMKLPFEIDVPWTYTGGPHTGWGEGEPWAAVDFAPPGVTGCASTSSWHTAVSDGVVVRTGPGQLYLDLDGDGDERTGWVVMYMHTASNGKLQVGSVVKRGDFLGHPSCEGGSSTGTHLHMARKYNGEWIAASGVLAYDLEGWIVEGTGLPYQGTMVRYGEVVIATDYSSAKSQITSTLSD
ncbi:MAG: LysM peptidoglycan-binding domain-containing protein [Anaerolineae bacterium]|nr:LysM peptidoglycan-binding domain-containing protein [Anaerolineae bacterium]